MRKVTPIQERFDNLAYPDPNSGCFIWGGKENSTGYGVFGIGSRTDGTRKSALAHRFAWELHHRSSIPAGLCVLHRCDQKLCVNPDHLFLGTVRENNQDMARKYRGRRSPRGLPFGAAAVKGGKKFVANITIDGRSIHLGHFDTAEEASKVARAAKDAHYA